MHNKYLIFLFLSLPLLSPSQIISTIAGNGTIGHSGDGGQASVATLSEPYGCTFDGSGNFYFGEVVSNSIRKITPLGIISTVAGISSGGYNGDGIGATAAELNDPIGFACDSLNNLYFADAYNNRIRKIDAISGIINTIAGNGTVGFNGDGGPASASILNGPEDICFDHKGNLYILDFANCRIRKIDKTGIITTVAGIGLAGFSGDGGLATLAKIEDMRSICFDDSDNLYFTQTTDFRIRKINSLGIISTIAGIGIMGSSGDNGPASNAVLVPERIKFDKSGKLFVSEYYENNIRVIDNDGIIHTIAGNGIAGFIGDGFPATSAELSSPVGLAFDSCNNLYVCDWYNDRIRKIEFNATCSNLKIINFIIGEELNIYPNPTYNTLNIDNLKTPSTYQLTNLIGKTTQQGTLREGNNTISLQYLPPGIYLLELIEEDGEKVVRKVLKE